MITLIDGLPENITGFKFTGKNYKQDYDKVVVPELKKLKKINRKINVLFIYESDISDFTAAATLKDIELGFKHFANWGNVAILTKKPSLEFLLHLFSGLLPGNVKGFSLEEMDKAKEWIINQTQKK